jgi:hypothetical protein
MTETVAQYQTLPNTVPTGPPQFIEPPLSPRARALVVGIRAALLMLVDALGEYAGLPRRDK